MALNEEDYPMTYKEYEKRVVELFLENYEGEALELMRQRVEEELKENPNYIQGFYGHDCFTYDHPEIYGENCKKTFDDYHLRQTPVANLRLLIG
ncbi:hypothetical protein [Methanobrevibacter thaueri]|uniref:Uncharacterized protein n=1 Tax=Methanobrevibacter thaueri TaxID=190975 RepID=A0A315XLX2_9EURY|nr:hypothetical protein [Methanobrevibacter thaueri]PWB87305.1 hypothetical protein MBBTH_11020 [Methanobrevibacter thaueri]